jgi:hypothetical protein
LGYAPNGFLAPFKMLVGAVDVSNRIVYSFHQLLPLY